MASAADLLPSERQVQRSILAMCGVCFPDVFITAIPNGAHLAGSRPVFVAGIDDVLRQCTVIELQERANDRNDYAELSIDLLRKGFGRSACNPAILIQSYANGLAIMERTGVYERDGRLYLPDEASPIASVAHG